jgi:hypothetical protein
MPRRQSQISSEIPLIENLSQEFERLYAHWYSVISSQPQESIYEQVHGASEMALLPSVGELVLRSAAVVEQTCGGITANLWDDPFEWTLPETLNRPERIIEHLKEVEALRKRAFSSLVSDEDLLKDIANPSGKLQSLASLLLQTLGRANQLLGQAVLAAEMIAEERVSDPS